MGGDYIPKTTKTNQEKILEKQQEIARLKKRISDDTERIKNLENDIKSLSFLDIEFIANQIDIPLSEVANLIKQLQTGYSLNASKYINNDKDDKTVNCISYKNGDDVTEISSN